MRITAEAEAKLQAYEALVSRWAPRIDLIAPQDRSRFRPRHIDDCLRLLPMTAQVPLGPMVDVGSGAGLPGVVLAIAGPGRTWRLLEPRLKKVAFLEEVVRELALDKVEIYPLTAAQAAAERDLHGAHVMAVARAVAPPEESFRLLRPLASPEGTTVIFVGKTAEMPPGAKEWARGILVEGRLADPERPL